MPYIVEAVLFLAPFALYALWLRFNPGRAVAAHAVALALLGLSLSIGAAIWYGLSRGMDPYTAYVPPRVTSEGIAPGHAGEERSSGAWPTLRNPDPGPPRP